MENNRNLITGIYTKFGPVARKVTRSYTKGFGLPCDLYFPKHTGKRTRGNYQAINLYEPHALPDYPKKPSVTGVYFYIPNLMKKESMNSIVDQFDNFSMKAQGSEDRPFIETDPDDELPIATKVVVHLDSSTIAFFVDKKTVVNGAGNQLLMRMYLSPLTIDTPTERADDDGGI